MSSHNPVKLNRRAVLASAAAFGATLASPALAQTGADTTEIENDLNSNIRRNISSFRSLQWQPYFSDTKKGAVLVDTTSRALHFWSEDQTIYRLYPTSVPLTEDLTRRGRTEVVRKVVGPEWRPTPAMKVRNPEWPDYVGPGPGKPARNSRALPLVGVLPDPRDTRYAQDRAQIVQWLYRVV